MSNDLSHTKHMGHMRRQPAAERRAALIAQCAQQRLEVRSLFAPAEKSGSLFGNLKLPLMIAGVVIGLFATRARRATPIITTGLSLWTLAGKVLPMLRLLRRATSKASRA
jgi:hypothetical protein